MRTKDANCGTGRFITSPQSRFAIQPPPKGRGQRRMYFYIEILTACSYNPTAEDFFHLPKINDRLKRTEIKMGKMPDFWEFLQ
ncbi:MAG: hypothetical protein FWC61_03770 [Proteobacteria bacterium]|nr:hypothetical protein [Pseudomonadota bacterium]